MSTIVVVRKNGRACIAAETQVSWGDMREDAGLVVNHDKIIRVGDSYLGIVGHCAHTQVLENYFARQRRIPALDSPAAIFETFRRLHEILKRDYYIKVDEDEREEYESSQISLLIANRHGIFGVYSFRDVEEYTRFFSFGSGNQYALGALEVLYDRLDDPEEIAAAAIAAACRFDKSSGLPQTSYTVNLRIPRPKKPSN